MLVASLLHEGTSSWAGQDRVERVAFFSDLVSNFLPMVRKVYGDQTRNESGEFEPNER